MRTPIAEKILNQIKKKNPPYIIKIYGLKIQVDKEVYPPSKESILLADYLKTKKFGIKRREKVLDYGTGSGFLSLVAAKLGGKVVAIDINPKAVKCSKNNIKQNNLKNIDVRESNSLRNIKTNEKFDIVISNLPYDNAKVSNLLEFAVYDPNFQMRKNLFNKIKKHLSEKGRILFTYSKRAQKLYPLERFSNKFIYKIVTKKFIDDELYFLYLIIPKK